MMDTQKSTRAARLASEELSYDVLLGEAYHLDTKDAERVIDRYMQPERDAAEMLAAALREIKTRMDNGEPWCSVCSYELAGIALAEYEAHEDN